jgi:hypothetical protein
MASAAKSFAIALLALVGMALPGGAGAQDAEGLIELIGPHVFRACADPPNLPFSNEAGEGFESKIAELFARKLGKSVAYTFYRDATGFVRNTLNAHGCDVVLLKATTSFSRPALLSNKLGRRLSPGWSAEGP